ncbi:DUF5990 family protein [Kitasatospora sp. NPDC048540]|uniref:DUF5990 family protein n=1 Tax=unclassified Kitasatospora TaxID=2633591 RepID=UPI00053B497A|nr:DUF5990 family protein [Kitasatospora sp. MBT63]
MQIRIEATALPGRHCPAGPGFPGASDIHVGVQRKDRPAELLGLLPADAPSAVWTLDCTAVPGPDGIALRGPYLQNRLGGRFVYLSWLAADGAGGLAMFRRAKLMLDAVTPATLAAAVEGGRLTARLGLTDSAGLPLCAAVRPPLISWSAGPDPA